MLARASGDGVVTGPTARAARALFAAWSRRAAPKDAPAAPRVMPAAPGADPAALVRLVRADGSHGVVTRGAADAEAAAAGLDLLPVNAGERVYVVGCVRCRG